MRQKGVDPDLLLSLAEGELSREEARELERRIGVRGEDRALYESLQLSVAALRGLPRHDAPDAVWEALAARYDDARRAPTRRPAPVLRLGRAAAAAAACLLVALLGIVFLRPGAQTPRVRFVQRVGLPPETTAPQVVFEFMNQELIRYQGELPDGFLAAGERRDTTER